MIFDGIGTGLAYIPFAVGLGTSLRRAQEVFSQDVGPIAGAIRANNEAAVRAGAIGSNVRDAIPSERGIPYILQEQGITSFDLSDANLRQVSRMDDTVLEQAMFDFLNTPTLGLRSDAIKQELSRMRSGASPAAILQDYATSPERRAAFFQALSKSQSSFGELRLRGAGFGYESVGASSLATTIKTGQLKSTRARSFVSAARSASGGLFSSNAIYKIRVPGSVSSSGGEGYSTVMRFSKGKYNFDIPLEQDIRMKVRGGKSLPMYIMHQGTNFETTYAMTRFSTMNAQSSDVMNFIEALYLGAPDSALADSPALQFLRETKERMVGSSNAAVGRRLASYLPSDMFDTTVGSANWIPNLSFAGSRAEASLRGELIKMSWWNSPEWTGVPVQEKLTQAARAYKGNLYAGASPKPMGEQGIIYSPSASMLELEKSGQLFKVPYEQNRRMFQAYFNPWVVSESNLKFFSKRFGPLGSNMKPWNRFSTPLMTNMSKGLSSQGAPFFNYFAEFVLPPGKHNQQAASRFREIVGEGGMAVRTTGFSQKTFNNLIGQRAKELWGQVDMSTLTPDTVSGITENIMARSKRWAQTQHYNRPIGPNAYFEYPRKVSRGTRDFIASEASPLISRILEQEGGIQDLAKRGFRLKTPIPIEPGQVLGKLATVSGNITQTANATYFGNQQIVGLQNVGGLENPMWRFTLGIDAPPQDIMKFFGSKVTLRPFNDQGMAEIARKVGLRGNTEIILAFDELQKNEVWLRTQQLTALQMYAGSDRRIANRLANESKAWEFVQGRGRAIVGSNAPVGTQGFFGMLDVAKRLKLNNQQFASIFAGELYTNEANVRRASEMGLVSSSQLQALEEAKSVVAIAPLSPGTISGELTGGLGSVERRAMEVLYRQLPDNLAASVIPDIYSRIGNRPEYAMALEWAADPKAFAKGAQVVDLRNMNPEDIAGLAADPFLEAERRVLKLPGFLDKKSIVLPSMHEMGRMEAIISGPSGDIPTAFRRSVSTLLEELSEQLATSTGTASTGRALANEALTNVIREQAGIFARLHRSMMAGKVAGSVVGAAAVYSPIDLYGRKVKTHVNEAATYITDAAFEAQHGQLRALGADAGYLQDIKKRFYKGQGYAGFNIRHPATARFSIFPTIFKRNALASTPGHPAMGKILPAAYFPETEALWGLPGGSVDDLKRGSVSPWRAAAGDYDFDTSHMIMMQTAETERDLLQYLKTQKRGMMQQVAEHSIAIQELGDMWKGSAEAGVAAESTSVADLRRAVGGSDDAVRFVQAGAALTGIRDTGMLSNAIAMLQQANMLLDDTRKGGAMSARESIGQVLTVLEQSPISSKKYGASLAEEVSTEIQRIMSNAGERMSKGLSFSAGEEIVKNLFGQGGVLERMNMSELLQEGGMVRQYFVPPAEGGGMVGRTMRLAITSDIQKKFAESINQVIETGGVAFLKNYQKEYKAIRNMSMESIGQMMDVFKSQTSSLVADLALGTGGLQQVLANQSSGVAEATLHSTNLTTKLKAFAQAAKGKWGYITKPLLLGTLLTAGMYHIMSPGGFAKEPLTMPGESVDPRLLAAIRSGQILSGGDAGPQSFDVMARYADEQAARHYQAGEITPAANSHTSAGGAYGRIDMPTARLAMANTPSYNLAGRASSADEADRIASHMQAQIPHARVGVTTRLSTNYLSANRQDDYL